MSTHEKFAHLWSSPEVAAIATVIPHSPYCRNCQSGWSNYGPCERCQSYVEVEAAAILRALKSHSFGEHDA